MSEKIKNCNCIKTYLIFFIISAIVLTCGLLCPWKPRIFCTSDYGFIDGLFTSKFSLFFHWLTHFNIRFIYDVVIDFGIVAYLSSIIAFICSFLVKKITTAKLSNVFDIALYVILLFIALIYNLRYEYFIEDSFNLLDCEINKIICIALMSFCGIILIANTIFSKYKINFFTLSSNINKILISIITILAINLKIVNLLFIKMQTSEIPLIEFQESQTSQLWINNILGYIILLFPLIILLISIFVAEYKNKE